MLPRVPVNGAVPINYHLNNEVRMLLCQLGSTCYTKEDTGKPMKKALYILQYAKDTSWAEAMSNSEKLSLYP